MQSIQTDKAPKAIGPYSQAIKVGPFLFCSGQIALNPETGEVVGTNVIAQTEQVMQNIRGILESQGIGLDQVVKSTVFLKNMNDFVSFNETYARFLKPPYPARSTVEVARLPKDVLVEIEVVAYVG